MAAGQDENWERLGDGTLLTQDADTGLGHIVPVATYNKIFASLLVLTVITVAVATVDLGILNLFVAVIIAGFKASLVTMFFMHARWESKLIVTVILYPILVLILLFLGTIGDASVNHYPDNIQDSIQEAIQVSEVAGK